MCCLKLLTQFKNLESCISGTSNEIFFPTSGCIVEHQPFWARPVRNERGKFFAFSIKMDRCGCDQENEVCDQIWTEETLRVPKLW